MKLRTILLILVLLLIASVSTGGYLYYSSLKESAIEEARRETIFLLKAMANHIDSNMSERQKSVKALSGLKELHQALEDKDENKILKANMILDHFHQSLNVDVCYLMDEQGNTIASSNRNSPDSFIGKNYSFRPYFQQAKQGSPSIYMALGVTSGKRGVYFSHPVYTNLNGLPSGVVVVKSSIEAIEKEMDQEYEGVMLITDPHGIIFVSNREDLLYHVLWKVSPDEIIKIAKTQQFGKGPLNWSGIERESENRIIDKTGMEYHIHQTEMKNLPGWKIIYLQDFRLVIKRISDPLFKTVGVVILFFCLFTGLAVFFLYREASHGIALRKKAEEALQKEKEFSDSLVNSLPGVFYLFDEKKLNFHRWNHNLENMTGYSSSEIAGMSPLELFDEYEGVRVAESIAQVFEKGYSTVEAAILTKNNERIPYFFTGHALKTEEETYLIGTGIDVSERNRAEQALRESEEKYRTLFDSSRDAIMTLAPPTWLFTSGNPATMELFRVRNEAEFISLGLWQLSPERQPDGKPSAEKAMEMIETAMRDGSHFFEWTHCHSDGTPFPAEVLLTRMEQRGQMLLQATVRNITNRKQAEKQRNKLIADLQKALSEVKTLQGFLPICSHCKKIRDDNGYWNQIESYIHKHSDTEFSHGICPECAKKYYPDVDIYDDNGEATED